MSVKKTRSGKKTEKASTNPSRDVSPEQALSEVMSALSLMEWEQQPSADITINTYDIFVYMYNISSNLLLT